MDSPLKTIEYFFPVVQVIAEPDFPDDSDVDQLDYEIKTGIRQSKEDKDKYQCHLEISSVDADVKKGEKNAYKINLVVIGTFKVASTWADAEKLVAVNGASILFSAAREYLITITSRGPWGPLMLPTVSFNNLEKESDSSESEEE